MSGYAGDLFIRIRPDSAGFSAGVQQQVRGSEAGLVGAGRRLGGTIATGILGGFAAVGLAEGLAHQISAGISDVARVQASTEAVRQEFGAASDSVLKFSETAISAFGATEHATLDVSARLGVLLHNLGIAPAHAAQMAVGLETVAASIAKIRGLDPATVFSNLPQALSGNLRSLKQLGFAFDQQELKQEAVRQGLIKTVKDGIDPAIKAQAIYGLVIAQLGDVQTKAALHNQDLAFQQHRLTAEWDHAREQLATGLLPSLTSVAKTLADNLPAAVHDTQAVFGALRTVLGPVVNSLGGIVRVGEILIGLKVASALRGWAAAHAAVSAAATADETVLVSETAALEANTAALIANTAALQGEATAAVEAGVATGTAAGEIAAVGGAAAVATGEVGLLQGRLAALSAIGPIPITFALSVVAVKGGQYLQKFFQTGPGKGVRQALGGTQHAPGSGKNIPAGWHYFGPDTDIGQNQGVGWYYAYGDGRLNGPWGSVGEGQAAGLPGGVQGQRAPRGVVHGRNLLPPIAASQKTLLRGLQPYQQLQIDALNAQKTKTLSDDLKVAQEIQAIFDKRVATTRLTGKKLFELKRQDAQAQLDVTNIQDQIAANRVSAASKRAQNAKTAATKEQAAIQQQIDALKAQISSPLDAEINRLQDQLNRMQAQDQRNSLRQQLQSAKKALADAKASVQTIGTVTAKQRKDIAAYLAPFRQAVAGAQRQTTEFNIGQRISTLKDRENVLLAPLQRTARAGESQTELLREILAALRHETGKPAPKKTKSTSTPGYSATADAKTLAGAQVTHQ